MAYTRTDYDTDALVAEKWWEIPRTVLEEPAKLARLALFEAALHVTQNKRLQMIHSNNREQSSE